MKIGRERTPLSQRLNTQTENQVDQAAALMKSALKSFESDCKAMLSDAQHTIKADIQALQNHAEAMSLEAQHDLEESLRRLKWITRLNPWILIAAIWLAGLLTVMSVTWMAHRMVEMQTTKTFTDQGFSIQNSQTHTYYLWDQNQLRLTDCNMTDGSQMKCLAAIKAE